MNALLVDCNYLNNKTLLLRMYHDATSEKFGCFIVDTRRQEYRKNLLGNYLFKKDEDDVSLVGVSSSQIVSDNLSISSTCYYECECFSRLLVGR